MSTTRREFLKASAAAGGALTLGLGSYACAPSNRSLNILILGGTNFTGPHLVRNALERGHSVSIFTRGRRELKRLSYLQIPGPDARRFGE